MQPASFFARASRGALATLAVDLGLLLVAQGIAAVGGSMPTSAEGVTTAALVLDGAFFAVLLVAVVGAPCAAALGARRIVPAELRPPLARTLLVSSAGLPLVLLAVPPLFLGHLALDASIFAVYYGALLIARAMLHGTLSAMSAQRP